MKYFIIFLILIGFTGMVYAPLTPEPEQVFDYTTCGEGASYQDGICIDNNLKPEVGECWGGPACTYDE